MGRVKWHKTQQHIVLWSKKSINQSINPLLNTSERQKCLVCMFTWPELEGSDYDDDKAMKMEVHGGCFHFSTLVGEQTSHAAGQDESDSHSVATILGTPVQLNRMEYKSWILPYGNVTARKAPVELWWVIFLFFAAAWTAMHRRAGFFFGHILIACCVVKRISETALNMMQITTTAWLNKYLPDRVWIEVSV